MQSSRHNDGTHILCNTMSPVDARANNRLNFATSTSLCKAKANLVTLLLMFASSYAISSALLGREEFRETKNAAATHATLRVVPVVLTGLPGGLNHLKRIV